MIKKITIGPYEISAMAKGQIWIQNVVTEEGMQADILHFLEAIGIDENKLDLYFKDNM